MTMPEISAEHDAQPTPRGSGASNPTAQRLATALLSFGLALSSACATSNPYDDERPAEVELMVTNELQSAVSAYVQWEGASPNRLGEVAGGSSTLTRVPVRGQDLRVFFVGLGQSPGDPREPAYASARPGDRFEWILRADRSIFYLRFQ